MANFFLYFVTVFIWGTTWLAMKAQVGEVPPEVSLCYRFVVASCLLLGYCKVRGLSLRFGWKDHGYIFLLAMGNFSLHLLCLYTASLYLFSGIVSVLFSLVSLFNILNSFLLFKKRPQLSMVLGAVLGLVGISLFFFDELAHFSFESQALKGMGYALLGGLIFSLGNMVFRRHTALQNAIVPSAAVAMVYGTVILLVYSLVKGSSFVVSHEGIYWGSFSYLAIVGSVGFISYLALISRIGAEKAGYATVFFPLVALLLSLVFENYRLGALDVAGVACVLGGNWLVMSKRRKAGLVRAS